MAMMALLLCANVTTVFADDENEEIPAGYYNDIEQLSKVCLERNEKGI